MLVCLRFMILQKIFVLLLILLFGAFFTPKRALACKKINESSIKKDCCKKSLKENSKESATKNLTTEKKSCCEKTIESVKNIKKSASQGECSDCSCDNTCSNVALVIPFALGLEERIAFIIPSNYFDTKSYLSTGFLSVWTPPNIS